MGLDIKIIPAEFKSSYSWEIHCLPLKKKILSINIHCDIVEITWELRWSE